MNNSDQMKSAKVSHLVLDESFNSFFQNDDVLKLSDKDIDNIYNKVSDNFLKESVYPHLTIVSKRSSGSKKLK